MAKVISEPTVVEAAGEPNKIIREFVGRVNSATDQLSLAVMESPSGWAEPGQTPEFDEYTLVLEGELVVEGAGGQQTTVTAGQVVHAPAGEWVRYSTPGRAGARYVAVCLPAFSPAIVHRDETCPRRSGRASDEGVDVGADGGDVVHQLLGRRDRGRRQHRWGDRQRVGPRQQGRHHPGLVVGPLAH